MTFFSSFLAFHKRAQQWADIWIQDCDEKEDDFGSDFEEVEEASFK